MAVSNANYRFDNRQSRLINVQTGNYTLTPDDNGAIVCINSGTGKTVTVAATLPIGFWCSVIQMGAGQVTFATSSTTINNRQSHTKTNAQHARVVLEHYSADVFNLSGDTGA